MKLAIFAGCLALTLLFQPASLRAEEKIVVSHSRIRVGDIVPDAASSIHGFDLGAAAPPGRSIYLSYEVLAERLRAGGISASALALPKAGVRIETLAKTFSPDELGALVRSSVEGALPKGVRLLRLRAFQELQMAPDATVGRVRLPKWALRDGQQTNAATVELLWGNQVVARIPIELTVNVEGATFGALVPRGASVTLSIKKGPIEISALAETLGAARVGDTVSLRVGVTRKILTATLVGTDRAELTVSQ